MHELMLIKGEDGKHTVVLGTFLAPKNRESESESVEVYNAQYCDMDVVVKVFKSSGALPSARADREVSGLKILTEAQCQHAPAYITDFKCRSWENPDVLWHYVVRSKLEGLLIENCLKLPEAMTDPVAIKKRIRAAFAVAIEAVRDCCVDNGSHYDGNILVHLGEKADHCYMVDFERLKTLHLWEHAHFPKVGQPVRGNIADGKTKLVIESTIHGASKRGSRAGVYFGRLDGEEIIVKVFAM
ncbi:Hypothetical predicted protein [Lecanosticta acicola]|uniref:Protein kinase domain-containing protein n=1 Tax=Lecanosticta acicola TaxID=111012 RepID=A0AAI8Z1P3_9PEZI|nr:Hypothetical predicted protein [Lecanosticta acicola]